MSRKLTPLQDLHALKFICTGCIEFDFDNIEKALKALEIIKEHLIYINDKGEVRFLPKNKHNVSIGILDKNTIDLLKEVLND